MNYTIEYRDGVRRKDIPGLPKTMRELIEKAIHTRLEIDPFSYGKPLSGSLKGHRRLRVGDYRIVYIVQPKVNVVSIIAIAHRKDIYEGF